MSFQKSDRTHKGTECNRLAAHIQKAAKAMDLCATFDKSCISASTYVYVSLPEDDNRDVEPLKIRCSDHADKHTGTDWYAWSDECPSKAISRLAEYFDRPVPKGYSEADYSKRSNSAGSAALIRSFAAADKEKEMISVITETISSTKTASKVEAWKVIDKEFPGIPRAQRQRIAMAAAGNVWSVRSAEATRIKVAAITTKVAAAAIKGEAALLQLISITDRTQ